MWPDREGGDGLAEGRELVEPNEDAKARRADDLLRCHLDRNGADQGFEPDPGRLDGSTAAKGGRTNRRSMAGGPAFAITGRFSDRAGELVRAWVAGQRIPIGATATSATTVHNMWIGTAPRAKPDVSDALSRLLLVPRREQPVMGMYSRGPTRAGKS